MVLATGRGMVAAFRLINSECNIDTAEVAHDTSAAAAEAASQPRPRPRRLLKGGGKSRFRPPLNRTIKSSSSVVVVIERGIDREISVKDGDRWTDRLLSDVRGDPDLRRSRD